MNHPTSTNNQSTTTFLVPNLSLGRPDKIQACRIKMQKQTREREGKVKKGKATFTEKQKTKEKKQPSKKKEASKEQCHAWVQRMRLFEHSKNLVPPLPCRHQWSKAKHLSWLDVTSLCNAARRKLTRDSRVQVRVWDRFFRMRDRNLHGVY